MGKVKYTKKELKALVKLYENKIARLEERILFLESDIEQEKDMKDIEDGR